MSLWTERRVVTLKERWAAGASASVIAAELGDVTRCAVIGKVYRLGLPDRPTTESNRKSPRQLVELQSDSAANTMGDLEHA